MNAKTWVEPGAIARLGEVLESLGSRSVLVVARPNSYALSGAKEKIEPFLQDRNVATFSDFRTNPRVEDVERGVALLHELQQENEVPPVVIGVGGGSAMDMAKLVAIFAFQAKPATECMAEGLPFSATGCPVVAIPTTSGTGSEVTHFATMYVGTAKHSVAHESIRPTIAIVDSELTMSLPPAITAYTGLDAICQAVESMWAVRSTEASRSNARQAITMALGALEDAVNHSTPESRTAMAHAAYLAGLAIDVSRTTASHAMSYGMTIRWDVPHGHAVALTLGDLLLFNSQVAEDDVNDPRGAQAVRDGINEICEIFGCSSPEEARDFFRSLLVKVGLPNRLSEVGIEAKADKEWLASSVNLERLGNNPRHLKHEQILGILEAVS